jgi:hypothetical protein
LVAGKQGAPGYAVALAPFGNNVGRERKTTPAIGAGDRLIFPDDNGIARGTGPAQLDLAAGKLGPGDVEGICVGRLKKHRSQGEDGDRRDRV